MSASVETLAFRGVETLPVNVEVHMSNGIPSFRVVGLADKAVTEAKERVRASLNSIGLSLPPKRITMNLFPADLPKEGSHYDLAMALSLLVALKVLPEDATRGYVVLGEVGLDASVRPCSGVVAAAAYALREDKNIICSKENSGDATWAEDVEVVCGSNLLETVNHLKGTALLPRPEGPKCEEDEREHLDLGDIQGQAIAKRALEIACAGRHHMLMVGPPGSGKSMLASRVLGLLPPLSFHEAVEVSTIHNLANKLSGSLKRQRPYCNPHHTASCVSMVGGGHPIKPGAISLAHRGVLFMDEFPEFSRSVIDALRQPIELEEIRVDRAKEHVTFPASFHLIAAMNHCKCGDDSLCTRGERCAREYRSKISAPIWDRFDLRIELPRVPVGALEIENRKESAAMKERIARCMGFQQERLEKLGMEFKYNGQLEGEALKELCQLDAKTSNFLSDYSEKECVSVRGFRKLLKVARTIADLDRSHSIEYPHLAEAIAYRFT